MDIKKHIRGIPELIVGLLIAAYPFLCRLGEDVAILSLVCAGVASAVAAAVANKRFRFTAADAMGGIAVLWIIAKYFISSQGMLGPNRFYEAAALCLIWFAVRNSQNPLRIVLFLLAGSLLQVIVCCTQLAGIVESNHALFPVTGSFFNPAPLAGFLAVTLFAYPYLWRRRGKIWMGTGFVATLVVVVWSGSRAAWLAILAGTVTCIMPWAVRRFRRLSYVKRIIAGGALTLAVTVACTGLYLLRPASADGRLLIWKASALLFAESPLCGNGPGAFSREYIYSQADYLETRLMSEEALLADSMAYAFNEPIRVLCEYGVVGLLIFGAFMAVVAAGSWKNRYSRYILAGFVSWLVFGLFSYPGEVYALRLLLIVLAALSAIESRTLRTMELKAATRIAAVMGAAAFLAAAAANYADYRRLGQAVTGLHKEEALTLPERQYRRFQTSPKYLYSYAGLLFSDKEYERAIPIFERAVLLHPSPLMLADLSKCYCEAGRRDDAEACLKAAVKMSPGYVTPPYELFNLYRREGRTDEARRWAEYILSRKFKVTNSATLFAKKEAREYLDAT